jgi:hypothetical protein
MKKKKNKNTKKTKLRMLVEALIATPLSLDEEYSQLQLSLVIILNIIKFILS